MHLKTTEIGVLCFTLLLQIFYREPLSFNSTIFCLKTNVDRSSRNENFYPTKFEILDFKRIFFSFVWISRKHKSARKIEYNYITSVNEDGKETKIVDLSREVHKRCNKSLKKNIGNSYIEMKFPAELFSKAENLADSIEKSIKRTQEILFPLQIEGVRFYLLQLDEVPLSYKITDELKGQNFYLHLLVFKNKEELNLDCSDDDKLCEGIYSTIPHELTHGAVENLVTQKNLKWFDEGLANYIGAEVSREFRPSVMQTKFKENVPKVSLHRPEIREGLWTWSDYANKKDTYFMRNQWFKYKASEQLLRLTIEESKKKGVENPLKVLFEELRKFREANGKAANAEDLISIIEQRLKVIPKELGVLDNAAQKQLVEEAIKILSESNLTDADKYYALIILASVDEVPLSIDWLKFLLKNVYTNREKIYLQNLAATALSRRARQKEFDEAVKSFLNENPNLKKLNLKNIKTNIEQLSIRQSVG
ncbi:hypothetical protein BH24ACI2_BH24ACI2_12540 [soil metagenome]